MGCGTTEPPVPPPAPPPPVVKAPVHIVADAEERPEGSGGPVPVELQYVGVGELHQRWFGDTDIVTMLSKELGACMSGRAVVRMSWDEPTKTGGIWLLLAGDQLTCRPSGGIPLDLGPMTPLSKALTAYRDQVAGRFDFRVASFKVGLEVLEKTHLCRLRVGGQFPPDGSTFDGCVDMGGEERCVTEAKEGTTRFAFGDPAHTAYLERCLR